MYMYNDVSYEEYIHVPTGIRAIILVSVDLLTGVRRTLVPVPDGYTLSQEVTVPRANGGILSSLVRFLTCTTSTPPSDERVPSVARPQTPDPVRHIDFAVEDGDGIEELAPRISQPLSLSTNMADNLCIAGGDLALLTIPSFLDDFKAAVSRVDAEALALFEAPDWRALLISPRYLEANKRISTATEACLLSTADNVVILRSKLRRAKQRPERKWGEWRGRLGCSAEACKEGYVAKLDKVAERVRSAKGRANGHTSAAWRANGRARAAVPPPPVGAADDSSVARRIRLAGIGRYLPLRIVLNGEIEETGGLPAGSVDASRVGVTQRRRAAAGETASMMAAHAAREVLAEAGLEPADIDCIINASGSPEIIIPDGGPLLQHALGLGDSGIPAFSVHGTCLSFLLALETAGALLTQVRETPQPTRRGPRSGRYGAAGASWCSWYGTGSTGGAVCRRRERT